MVAIPKALNGIGAYSKPEGGTGSVGFQKFILTNMNNSGMTVSRSRVGNPAAIKIYKEEKTMFKMVGKYTKAKVMIDDIDQTAITQIISFLNNPAFTNPVAVMPDCHAGAGAVIGFTMPLTDKIIPNVIGVDIGCGVHAQRLSITELIDRKWLDGYIRERIPFGYEVHKEPIIDMEKEFPWEEVRQTAKIFWEKFNRNFFTNVKPVFYDYDWFVSKCEDIKTDVGRTVRSLGTLGGGK